MYKNTLLTVLFAFCSLTPPFSWAHQKTVVFDLGDTLIITEDFAAFRQVGLLNFAVYLTKNSRLFTNIYALSRTIEERFFNVLDVIEPRHENETQTYSPRGFLLPQLMCSWMKGTRSASDTYELIMHTLTAHPEYCANQAEYNLIMAMSRLTFTPKIFASTRKLAPHALELVHYCKQQGYRIAVLSNWDPESFTLVQNRFPELFNLVDDIMISGQTSFLKPDPRAYDALLDKNPSSSPSSYTFIDDRPENIITAIKIGMNGVQCPIVGKTPDLQHVHLVMQQHLNAYTLGTFNA
jgi:HAD superfamily hydrolase (TIGR01509 family)